ATNSSSTQSPVHPYCEIAPMRTCVSCGIMRKGNSSSLFFVRSGKPPGHQKRKNRFFYLSGNGLTLYGALTWNGDSRLRMGMYTEIFCQHSNPSPFPLCGDLGGKKRTSLIFLPQFPCTLACFRCSNRK